MRWLVMFFSHPEPPADMTFVDVRAPSSLAAIVAAREEQPLAHGWSLARAVRWPIGAADVDEAVARLTGT